MQLDLNLLTALNALLEEESVSGAADRLHLSEPAMSRSLGRIRRVTGDPILVRTGRTMTPTPRAIALRHEVRGLVLRSRAVLSPETELDLTSLERVFTLRGHDALASALAPALMRRLSSQAPRASLRFLGEASGETPDLGRGSVDLQIGSETPASPDIAHQHVADDHLVGLTAARETQSDTGDTVSLEAFAASAHVVVSRRGRFHDQVDSALAASGLSRRVIASAASTAAAVEIVRDTGAIVTVPSSVAGRLSQAQDLESFELPVDLPRVPIVLSWHRRLEPDLAHAWLRTVVSDEIRALTRPSN